MKKAMGWTQEPLQGKGAEIEECSLEREIKKKMALILETS